jgi:ABC-type multidrug transport system fused ATPase/permease subunit
MEMLMPAIVRQLTEHVTDADADPNQGIFLLVASFILQLVRHYMNELCFYNNFVTGFMITSTIESMIVKKMMNMKESTIKNYEQGQIQSIKDSSGRLHWSIYEFIDLLKTPITLVYCSYRLFQEIGVSFLFSILLLVIAIKLREKLHERLYELHFDNGKLHEKMSNMTHESFESIRAIKLYGWNEFFREKIMQYTNEQKTQEDKIHAQNRIIDFVWEFLFTFMNPVAYCAYLGMGGSLTLPKTMEVIMLMD